MLIEKIREHQRMFNSKCENIRWILASHLAYTVLLSRPDITDVSPLPDELNIDGIKVSTREIFGSILQPKDRQKIIDENLAAARRLLTADVLDQLVESFCRSYAIFVDEDHIDPYEKDDSIYFAAKRLYKGIKEAKYFTEDEKEFLKGLANPFRNIIRHHNGIVPPKGEINYHGTIDDVRIALKLGKGKGLQTNLNKCNTIYVLIRNIGNRAFSRLIDDAREQENAG